MTSPLPNSGDENSDCGQSLIYDDGAIEEFHCVVRITPCGQFTTEQIKDWFTIHSGLEKFVMGIEASPQGVLHYHIVGVTHERNPKEMIFRAFIDEMWPKEDRVRGFGNKQWNFQLAKDPDAAVSYAIKHGEYTYFGYSEDYIMERKEESFVKPQRTGFQQELDALNKRFEENHELQLRDYMNEFVSLKARFKQMVNLSHAHQYALSAVIRRDPNSVSNYVDYFLSHH